MKKVRTLIILSAAILCIASANGVAEEQNRDRTGSPDGSNTCNQCHLGGGYNPQMTIQIEDIMDQEVTAYVPGEIYELTFQVSSIPFPTVFGFQATALFADLSDAGTFSDPGTGVQIEEVNTAQIPSRHIIEHSNPGFVGNFQVMWTAPTNGEVVTFYASAVTANGNSEPEGDKATSITLSLPAFDPDDIQAYLLNEFELRTTVNRWIIEAPIDQEIEEIMVLDQFGRSVGRSSQQLIIDRTDFSAGIYFIRVKVNDESIIFKALNI